MSSYAFHTTYKNNPLFHAQEHTSYLISHDNIDLNSSDLKGTQSRLESKVWQCFEAATIAFFQINSSSLFSSRSF